MLPSYDILGYSPVIIIIYKNNFSNQWTQVVSYGCLLRSHFMVHRHGNISSS